MYIENGDVKWSIKMYIENGDTKCTFIMSIMNEQENVKVM